MKDRIGAGLFLISGHESQDMTGCSVSISPSFTLTPDTFYIYVCVCKGGVECERGQRRWLPAKRTGGPGRLRGGMDQMRTINCFTSGHSPNAMSMVEGAGSILSGISDFICRHRRRSLSMRTDL